MFSAQELMTKTIEVGASDLHLNPGRPPVVRVHGRLEPLGEALLTDELEKIRARGGEVIGVIPEKLQDLELGHTGCTELHVVDTMHTRKQMMMDLSDGFIAMPGGYGTLEELFEVVTWGQLNYHRKPVALYNVAGFYDHLVAFVQHAVDQGFVREELRHLIEVGETPAEVLAKLSEATVPDLESWLSVD